ncbi:hypothetical protein GCM10023085_69530 [Actinomadura viridis]|uniref:Uncharacterized protein n=1 Tax=Actinomadura viridis TaxID=58110 RepID=A0A931DK44_9ACTN|nr:hypothetical protein [Actinomadura viridis]MBG6090189.1 hypothetical protein [Actinomadura viridis]
MRARVRSTAAPAAAPVRRAAGVRIARASFGATALASALVLSGCGGGEPPAQAGGGTASSPPPVPVPSVPTSAPPAAGGRPSLPAVPKVRSAEVKPLVGRWSGPGGDYFLFKADGSGSWMKGGQALWNGQVIPEGKGRFRFSWQGGDPKTASYWGATLTGESRLLFAGTNQTYTKAK